MKEDTRIGLIGFFLMILPLFSYLISSSLIQTSRIVRDTSFVVQPGETKYLGYNYITADLECTQLVLTGEVSVEGEGINLTMWGYAQAPRTIDGIDMQGASIYVESQYNFTIIIEWGASFDFDNRGGNSASIVRFILKEDATKYLSFVGRWLGLHSMPFSVPIGALLLIGRERLVRKIKKRLPRLEVEERELYDKLIDIYTQIHGSGRTRALESKIASLREQGLSREEAIRKIAEKEGLIIKE